MATVRMYPVFTVTLEAEISADQAQDFMNTYDWRSARGRLINAVSAMASGPVDDARVAVSGLRVIFEHLAAVRPARGEDT